MAEVLDESAFPPFQKGLQKIMALLFFLRGLVVRLLLNKYRGQDFLQPWGVFLRISRYPEKERTPVVFPNLRKQLIRYMPKLLIAIVGRSHNDNKIFFTLCALSCKTFYLVTGQFVQLAKQQCPLSLRMLPINGYALSAFRNPASKGKIRGIHQGSGFPEKPSVLRKKLGCHMPNLPAHDPCNISLQVNEIVIVQGIILAFNPDVGALIGKAGKDV